MFPLYISVEPYASYQHVIAALGDFSPLQQF